MQPVVEFIEVLYFILKHLSIFILCFIQLPVYEDIQLKLMQSNAAVLQ